MRKHSDRKRHVHQKTISSIHIRKERKARCIRRSFISYGTIHATHTVTSTPAYAFSFHKSKLFIPSFKLSHHAPWEINTPLGFESGAQPLELFALDCINAAVMNHFIWGWVSLNELSIVVYSITSCLQGQGRVQGGGNGTMICSLHSLAFSCSYSGVGRAFRVLSHALI